MSNAVRYTIDWSRVRHDHTFEVEATFSTKSRRELELFLPVWTPGSYLIREYARQVEHLDVLEDPNLGITITKVRKNAWRLAWADEIEHVRVRYRLYAREKSVRTNWIEPELGFIVGAATFISSEDYLHTQHVVEIVNFPSDLSLDSSLDIEATKPTCYSLMADSFHELVDSPVLIGKLDCQDFEIDGKSHRLVSVGDLCEWDLALAARDTEVIVRTVQRFWREVPYEAYRFQNLVLGGYGGLEHDNCCVLMSEPHIMADRNSYVDWLGLVCHEYFHTWNVRRLRPKGLVSYDYQNEQYVRELWVAEGITSYFDDLLVYRAGLCNEAEYLQRLSKAVHTVMTAPGRNVQSLEDSSFDTWIKLYRPDENSHNSRISYYTKGAVVAWLLDVELARRSEFRVRLDDVMRTLWTRYKQNGYELSDFERIVAELVPGEWSVWFDRMIRSTQELVFDDAVEFLGLRWKSEPALDLKSLQSIATTVPNAENDLSKRASLSLSCETKDQSGRVIISKLFRGGCASQSGLQVDDELVALGGYRLTSGNLTTILQRFNTDEPIAVTFFRREVLREISVTLDRSPREWKLESIPDGSTTHVENRKRWLQGN